MSNNKNGRPLTNEEAKEMYIGLTSRTYNGVKSGRSSRSGCNLRQDFMSEEDIARLSGPCIIVQAAR